MPTPLRPVRFGGRYGELSNGELLSRYGFVLPLNPFDKAPLEWAAFEWAAELAIGPQAWRHRLRELRNLADARCSECALRGAACDLV